MMKVVRIEIFNFLDSLLLIYYIFIICMLNVSYCRCFVNVFYIFSVRLHVYISCIFSLISGKAITNEFAAIILLY